MLALAASAVFFSSCPSPDGGKASLSISEEEVEFDANGYVVGKSGEREFWVEVNTNVKDWTVTRPTSERWITIVRNNQEPEFGVKVESYANTSEDRYGTITVQAGEAKTVTLEVIQNKASASGGGLNFNDIARSTYAATGTHPNSNFTGPLAWTGNVQPHSTDPYYAISNWATLGSINMFLDFEGGKLYLDNYMRVGDRTGYPNEGLYWSAAYLTGTDVFVMGTAYKHEVSYNKNTRTLNFSGTHDGNQLMVVLVARNNNTGAPTTFFRDTGYFNANLVLTPSQSSSSSGNAAMRASSMPRNRSGSDDEISAIPLEHASSVKTL